MLQKIEGICPYQKLKKCKTETVNGEIYYSREKSQDLSFCEKTLKIESGCLILRAKTECLNKQKEPIFIKT